MSTLKAYRVGNHSIEEEHGPDPPLHELEADLRRPFNERIKDKIKIKIIERLMELFINF